MRETWQCHQGTEPKGGKDNTRIVWGVGSAHGTAPAPTMGVKAQITSSRRDGQCCRVLAQQQGDVGQKVEDAGRKRR